MSTARDEHSPGNGERAGRSYRPARSQPESERQPEYRPDSSRWWLRTLVGHRPAMHFNEEHRTQTMMPTAPGGVSRHFGGQFHRSATVLRLHDPRARGDRTVRPPDGDVDTGRYRTGYSGLTWPSGCRTGTEAVPERRIGSSSGQRSDRLQAPCWSGSRMPRADLVQPSRGDVSAWARPAAAASSAWRWSTAMTAASSSGDGWPPTTRTSATDAGASAGTAAA